MRDAGMQVETTPMEIDARQLPPPVVKYGSGVGLVSINFQALLHNP